MVEVSSPNALRKVLSRFPWTLNKQTLILCITYVFYIGILRDDVSVTILVWQANNCDASSCFQARHLFDSPLIYWSMCKTFSAGAFWPQLLYLKRNLFHIFKTYMSVFLNYTVHYPEVASVSHVVRDSVSNGNIVVLNTGTELIRHASSSDKPSYTAQTLRQCQYLHTVTVQYRERNKTVVYLTCRTSQLCSIGWVTLSFRIGFNLEQENAMFCR